MADTLRPLSTGELLDRTFGLYRNHFRLFETIAVIGPAALLAFRISMLSIARLGRSQARPGVGMVTSIAAIGMIGAAVLLLGTCISFAATVHAVSAVHTGKIITAGEAFGKLKGRVWRLLGVVLHVSVRVLVGSGLLFGLALGLAAFGAPIAKYGTAAVVTFAIVVIAAFVVAALLATTLFVRYSLAIPCCMVEDISPSVAIKRSVWLSKGARKRILSVMFVTVMISWIVGAAFGALSLPLVIRHPFSGEIISMFGGFVAGTLTGPLGAIAIALVYFDERVRKEALDLELMLAALDSAGGAPAGVVPESI